MKAFSQRQGASGDDERRRLDDSILHATIVKQDEPSNDQSSIYHVFERLNTGGTSLLPQEIRACIFYGEFNELLKRLNENKSWRSIFGDVSSRMRDQELILRFLALYFNGDNYARPMKEFLNTYMGENRHLKTQSSNLLSQTFESTIEIAQRGLGNDAFRPRRAFSAAVYDAVMVGIARRLAKGPIEELKDLYKAYASLLKSNAFDEVTDIHTTNEEIVSKRIDLATDAFANLR